MPTSASCSTTCSTSTCPKASRLGKWSNLIRVSLSFPPGSRTACQRARLGGNEETSRRCAMMLQALIAYAERENLGDADFEPVGVRWFISLDKAGKPAGGPIPLSENPDDKKPRPKQMLRPFTSPNELNQGTKSHFLCDTLERATLLLDPKAAEKAEARRVQHGYYQALLKEAAAACPDDSARLLAVLSFLQNQEAVAELH